MVKKSRTKKAKLAIKISQIEKIPLLTTKLNIAEIKERLSNV